MLRDQLTRLVEDAIANLPGLSSGTPVEITDTKTPEHGDYACSYALMASKAAGKPPREIAEMLKAELLASGKDLIEAIDVAGPGFLNFRLKPQAIGAYVPEILQFGDKLSHANAQPGRRLNIEFVSVNPNGPITVGSGRGAAFGDTLCNVLEAAGEAIHREYYINDGLNSQQMRLFGMSVRALALGEPLPENGYKGEYVNDVAQEVRRLHPDAASHEDIGWWQEVSQELMIERQRSDLAMFGVRFDEWFSEQSMHDCGLVTATLDKLVALGEADDKPFRTVIEREGKNEQKVDMEQEAGPLWLRSTKFGDDKDRVLRRSDGRPAYIAADAAYFESKLGEREFEKAYLIVGPDHHGYIPRMYAVCQALGYPVGPEGRFEMIIFQLVRFVKDGQPAPMRKRDGNIYELRDLIHELGTNMAPSASQEEQVRIGRDVSRFFYLMRSHDTHMDFDIDLATKKTDENPVFYAQYAHARICSVLAKAETFGEFDASLLVHPREAALIKKILDLPYEVQRIAKDFGVHRLTTYAVELARTYHHFYDACRVIQPDQPELSKARAALCLAARHGLKSTFNLLGVSAPERMERDT